MSNDLKIVELLQSNKEAFIFDDFEEVVIKFINDKDKIKAFAKRKNREPYELETTCNLVYKARLGGEMITKVEFDNF